MDLVKKLGELLLLNLNDKYMANCEKIQELKSYRKLIFIILSLLDKSKYQFSY